MARSGGFEGLKARSATGSTEDIQMMAQQIETIISQSESQGDDQTTSDDPQKAQVVELLSQILPLLSTVMKQKKSATN